ncbi:MAG: PD40 domain-containing protein [Ignavibacteriales bacterium]|nr:PD40 domain-containing protein [Ignavibacteriales bacterium]
MKHILTLTFVISLLLCNQGMAENSLALSSSGKVFYNVGEFPDSFQLWHLPGGNDRPWAQSNTVGNPSPSIIYSESGHNGSNDYSMGGVASSLIYQADVMFTNPSTAEGIYMHFRAVDTNNFYNAKYGPYYGGILTLDKNVGGIGTGIVSPLYGLPSSANTWYNLEVRAIGSSLQIYFDHTLKINATDNSLSSGLTGMSLGICCSNSNTWYVDNIKVFKSYQIAINNLQSGQRADLYDETGNLKTLDTVNAGQTNAILDVSSLSFPFTGYFKIYDVNGNLLLTSQTSTDIWGGDVYNFQSETSSTTRIAFASDRDGNWEIYTMNPDGSDIRRLTFNDSTDAVPNWSHDGTKIAFVSNRDGNNEIYTMSSDGTNQMRLTNNNASDNEPAWSPDDAKIVFVTDRTGNGEIFVMNADGTNPINLTNNPNPNESGPKWSPDGTKIAFSSWRGGDARIYIMNSDGSNPTLLSNTLTWCGSPTWSPDGSRIAYSAWNGIYVIDVDGSNNTLLLDGGNCCISPGVGSWSPDGMKMVLFTDLFHGNYEIYTIDSDGTNLVRLTNNSANDQSPSWSPVLNPTTNIDLIVGEQSVHPFDTILVPVNVEFPVNTSFSSSEINFGGYSEGLHFLYIVTDNSLIGNAGWSVSFNEVGNEILTASAGSQDISGSGVLFWLKFAVTGNICTFAPIEIRSATFNTGTTSVTTTNGGVNIKAIPHYGDVDENGSVQAYDASKILKHIVGLDTLECQGLANGEVSLDDNITSMDASLILRYIVHLIDSLPWQGNLFLASGNLQMQSATYYQVGDTVTISAALTAGVNILSYQGVLDYDRQKLKLISLNSTGVTVNDSFIANDILGNTKFAGASGNIHTSSGNFATLKFKVLQNFDSTIVSVNNFQWNQNAGIQNISTVISKSVGVNEQTNDTPKEFSLAQNYPNPFNPTTTINFAIPVSGFVSLKVFNLLGEEVATVVNEHLEIGTYNVDWNASNVPSGMYFYRLAAGEFTETKKLLLMK